MAVQASCRECGAKLSGDEIAIYLKLVSRNARDYLCMDCLSVMLKCERKAIEDRIRYYRESGNCVLFK
jgi:biotin operon repressor